MQNLNLPKNENFKRWIPNQIFNYLYPKRPKGISYDEFLQQFWEIYDDLNENKKDLSYKNILKEFSKYQDKKNKKAKLEEKIKSYQDFKLKIKEIKKQEKEYNKLLKEIKKDVKSIHKTIINNNPKNIPEAKYFYEKKYNFKLIFKSKFDFKKKLGELYNYDAEYPLNTNNTTLDIISSAVYKRYQEIKKKMEEIYPQGFYIIPKLIFKTGPTSKDIISFTLNQNEKIEDINILVKKRIIDKFHNSDSEFDALFISTTFFIFPLSIKGGCNNCVKQIDKIKTKERTIKIISPKSTNNNCLFMCFVHFLHLNGNSFNFAKVRKDLQLGDGMVKIENIDKISDFFKIGYILINQKQEIIKYKNIINNDDKAHIMLMNDHYYIVENIDYITCRECGINHNSDKVHVCNNKRISYYNNVITKKREYVQTIDPTEKEIIKKDVMIFFDLETFQESVSHVPYACGYSFGNHENVIVSYGKNCMDSFINHILNVDNKIICAYNGSGFDFYILINYLKK